MNNLANSIIKKIKDGEVSMQPRWHFVLKTALMMVGVVMVAFIAIYLFSFVIFTLHKSGLWFAPQFGYRGMMMFVIGSPWLLLSVLGVFLLLLYILVSRYSFSYRKPLVYSIIGVVLLVVGVSSLIQYFGVHNRVQSFAEQHGVPGLRMFYQAPSDQRPPGMVYGTIIEVTDNGFVIETDKEEELVVTISNKTKSPPDIILLVGTEILVFGEISEDEISAFGIKPATDGQFGTFPRKQREGYGGRKDHPRQFINHQDAPQLINPVIE